MSMVSKKCVKQTLNFNAPELYKCPAINFSREFISEFKEDIRWDLLSRYSSLINEKFVRDYKDLVDWKVILKFTHWREEFLEEFIDIIPSFWEYVTHYQFLSEEFVEKYKDKVNWINVATYQGFNEEFLNKYLELGYISDPEAITTDKYFKEFDKEN